MRLFKGNKNKEIDIEQDEQMLEDLNRQENKGVPKANIDRKNLRKKAEKPKQRKRKIEGHGKKKVSTLEYFIEEGLNRITKGSLDIQGTQFEISYSKVLSERHAKRVIFIREFPQRVYPGNLELFRREMYKQLTIEERREINLSIIEHTIPNKIRIINNKKLAGSEVAFRRQRSQYIRDKNVKETNIRTAMTLNASKDDVELIKKKINRLDRKIDSFEIIRRHQASGGETLKTYIFMEITGRTTEQVDKGTDIVLGLLTANNYKTLEVFDLENYLNTFGIASLNYNLKPDMDIHPLTLTTDISSLSSTYSEGIIRSEQGDICVGHSVETNYPVHVSFSESSDASNILMVADTGSGKTVMAKCIALGALNHEGNTYNVILNDYKGEEHDKVANIVKGSHIISTGLRNPKFINTLIIPDSKKYNFPDDKSSYYLASNTTALKLSLLVGIQNKDNVPEVEDICTDIVDRIYSINDIDVRMPSTYVRSRDLVYKDEIWKAIKYVTTESSDMEIRHSKKTLSRVKTSLEHYFSPTGSKTYMYSNPVDIDTMMDSKLIVFDYGTQTVGGSGSLLEKEVQTRMFQKEYFSTLYTAYKKSLGEYTMEIDEEVQRQLNNRVLMEALNQKMSVGRSNNRINLIILNSIKGLLDSTNPNAAAIRDNMNTIMLGRVKKSVADDVLDYFGLNQARGRIDPVLQGVGKYQNSFLCAINTGKMFDMFVTTMKIPPRLIRETDLFKSKDVETNKTTIIQ